MNVTPGSIDIYVNGELSHSNKLPRPMDGQKNRVAIGNVEDYHYYTGAISEVAVDNKILSKEQVQETWEKIRQVITR